MVVDGLDILGATSLVVVGGVVVLAMVSYLPLPSWRKRPAAPAPVPPADPPIFLFEGGALVDATEAGWLLLDLAPPGPDERARITGLLAPRVPGLADRLAALAEGQRLDLEMDGNDGIGLSATRHGDCLRLALSDASEGLCLCPVTTRLLRAEYDRLRQAADLAPLPIWLEAPDGSVAWVNRSYLRQAGSIGPDGVHDWPLPPLFDPATLDAGGQDRRRGKSGSGDQADWFDCHVEQLADGYRAGFALPATATVRAETALRDFMQTLTRTFANLPIGLAVFDGQMRLSLFNPPLADMTGLPATFLSGRPTLHAVLDRLRELRMIPEPRNYASWRQRLSDIERAADAGQFTELWPLPSGRVFRVTGQPDISGGLALLFSDVTLETAENRKLRIAADTARAAIEETGRALTLLDGNGTPVLQTAACAALWAGADDAGTDPAPPSIRDWQSACEPCDFWNDLNDHLTDPNRRRDWTGCLPLNDGRWLRCRCRSLAGRATLLEFDPVLPDRVDDCRESSGRPAAARSA